MKTHTHKLLFGMLSILMLVSTISVVSAQGMKPGYKKKGDSRWTRVDAIQYSPAGDQYQIRGATGARYPLDRKLVVALDMPKPTNWDQYRINASAPARATPATVVGLEGIRKKSAMLKWDIESLKLLIPIYDHKRQYSKVIKECDYLRKWYGKVPDELQGFHWKALSQDKSNIPALKKVLKEAIASGNRQSAAMAHILRGDILRDQARYKEALVDGYFRVILLFKDVKGEIQPEAHFKAWEVLKKVRDSRAEKIKRKLLDEFPRSEYAQRLGAAGSSK